MLKCWLTELDIKEKMDKQLKLFHMDVREYQEIIQKTAIFPEEIGIPYCTMGLCGEAGEVAEKVKKLYRDKNGTVTEEFKQDIKKELGDVVWYVTALGDRFGLTLEEILEANYTKLIKRRETNTLHGSGDNREE